MTGSHEVSQHGEACTHVFHIEEVGRAFAILSPVKTEIETVPFLKAFKELAGLLEALGLAPLRFVQNDIHLKISYIETLVHKHEEPGKRNPYAKLHDMLQWEVDNKCLEQKTSGGWNLVRLRRALDFISTFLEEVKESEATTTTAAYNAYHKTLAAVHPWAIRQLVSVAVYALPSKEQFLQRVNVSDNDHAAKVIDEVLLSVRPVLASVYELYDDFNLNHLK